MLAYSNVSNTQHPSHLLPLQVVRIFVDMVDAQPSCLRAVQAAHGVAAIITLLQTKSCDTRLAPAAQQVSLDYD